jgi:hypothetical protein
MIHPGPVDVSAMERSDGLGHAPGVTGRLSRRHVRWFSRRVSRMMNRSKTVSRASAIDRS